MIPYLIVTRPAGKGTVFADRVRQKVGDSVDVIQSPLIEIVELHTPMPRVQGLILTSGNGVAQAVRMKVDQGTPVWCVGARTAEFASTAGFDVKAVGADSNALKAKLLSNPPKGALAHIRGQHTTGVISQTLCAAGIACEEVIAYDQKAIPLSENAQNAANGDRPVIFPLFSARTATILDKAGPFKAPLHLIAISEAVKSALPVVSYQVAARPDRDAMIDATIGRIKGLSVT